MSPKIERMTLLVLRFESYETLGRFFFADLIRIGSHIIGLRSLHRVETALSPTIFFKYANSE